MSKFAGNCSHIIDWEDVIEHLEDKEPGILIEAKAIETKATDPNYPTYPGEKEHDTLTLERWKNAGYDFSSSYWYLYRPETHFSVDVENKLAEFLNITPMHTSIFKIPPGCNAPVHFETGENPNAHAPGKEIRVCSQIRSGVDGQVLIIESEVFHNCLAGNLYQWDHFTQMHAVANCGLEPAYYMFIQGVLKN